jgi:anaerobic C4-dicarboxylate transporter
MNKMAIILLICLIGAANASTTYFDQIVDEQKPYQAIRDVFTDIIGQYFWIIVAAIFFIGVWIRTMR